VNPHALRSARIRIKLCERAVGKALTWCAKVRGTAGRDCPEVPAFSTSPNYCQVCRQHRIKREEKKKKSLKGLWCFSYVFFPVPLRCAPDGGRSLWRAWVLTLQESSSTWRGRVCSSVCRENQLPSDSDSVFSLTQKTYCTGLQVTLPVQVARTPGRAVFCSSV